MKKSFYENGRMKFYQRQQLIVLDGETFAAIAITFIVLIFCGLIILMLGMAHLLPNIILEQISPKQTSNSTIKKGDTQPLELSFVESPVKQTIQKALVVNKEIKPKPITPKEPPKEEKVVVNQHKEAPLPKPIKRVIAKKVEKNIKQKKEPVLKKDLPQLPASTTDNSNDTFQVKSVLTEDESYSEKRVRLYLTAQVQQKINLYKKYIPEEFKYIGASYIMKVELSKNQKAKTITITKSNNRYLNLYVKRTFNTIEYPPVERYKLEKYEHTFVIYYKPLVRR